MSSESEVSGEPRLLPVLPLKNTLLFPFVLMPVSVGRGQSVAAMEAALANEDKMLVVVAQRDPTVEQPGQADLHPIGTRAVIKRMARGEHALELILQGIERVTLSSVDTTAGYLRADVVTLPLPADRGTEIDALRGEILTLAAKIQDLAQIRQDADFTQALTQITDPLHLVYLLGSMLGLPLEKEQALLEVTSCAEALRLLHQYMTYEMQVLQLRMKIASEAQSEMTKEQREYQLRQQLRAIREELGEEEHGDLGTLKDKLQAAELPDEIRQEAERELGRLEQMSPSNPDYQLTRTYLELIADLPWTAQTDDDLDLKKARQVLDEDHYDLKEVKERIIEQLAVLKLNPDAKAPILCFVGPPGVGKTSLGKSIARALGRKFERMSLGGLHDEAELRGHRRTYIGAMPGRIIQAIRRAGVRNPVLMLDEVDKLGRDFRGDPAAALLEILDPEQNSDFHDNYLDLAFDLSKVMFITTANALDTIPGPLLDRMELLRLPGYSDQEKLQIARRYLIGRQEHEAGLADGQLTIPDDTVLAIIHDYTREAGVRQLERALGRVCRKVAVQFAEGNPTPVSVSSDDLDNMLGSQRYHGERARKQLPPGVAVGLAWTEAGGEVLYVEAIRLRDGNGLTLTGQLGEVMQESARAAHSFVLSQAEELGITDKSGGVHIHVPAGAVPKDGPSAGVTMMTALASLYTRQPVRNDTAMTGEISLTGLVFPVGGVKEKILAAHRAGMKQVILPKENERDLRELPDNVREQIHFVLAERVEDVFTAAIPGLADRLANTRAGSVSDGDG